MPSGEVPSWDGACAGRGGSDAGAGRERLEGLEALTSACRRGSVSHERRGSVLEHALNKAHGMRRGSTTDRRGSVDLERRGSMCERRGSIARRMSLQRELEQMLAEHRAYEKEVGRLTDALLSTDREAEEERAELYLERAHAHRRHRFWYKATNDYVEAHALQRKNAADEAADTTESEAEPAEAEEEDSDERVQWAGASPLHRRGRRELSKERSVGLADKLRAMSREELSALLKAAGGAPGSPCASRSAEASALLASTLGNGATSMLCALSVEALRQLCSVCVGHAVSPSTEVVVEGDVGDSCYLVLAGTLTVSRKLEGRPTTLATLRAGDHFGDLALLRRGGVRAATVRTLTDCRLLQFLAADFSSLLGQSRMRWLSERLAFLARVPICERLPPDRMMRLAGALKELSFKRGERVINQGELVHGLFIVYSGRLHVNRDVTFDEEAAERRIHVGVLGPKGVFGERSLLQSATKTFAAATVEAETACSVLFLARSDFGYALAGEGVLREVRLMGQLYQTDEQLRAKYRDEANWAKAKRRYCSELLADSQRRRHVLGRCNPNLARRDHGGALRSPRHAHVDAPKDECAAPVGRKPHPPPGAAPSRLATARPATARAAQQIAPRQPASRPASARPATSARAAAGSNLRQTTRQQPGRPAAPSPRGTRPVSASTVRRAPSVSG